jgi:hypothetical protein
MMMIFAFVEIFAPFDFFFPALLVFAGFALEVLEDLAVVLVTAEVVTVDLMRVDGT